MKPLVIYHGNCADGFGAAWAVWKYFRGEAEFFPGFYQKPPPNVKGRDVIIVDFSYKKDVLWDMTFSARSLLVLDHHKTAAEDLVDFKTSQYTSYGQVLHDLPDGHFSLAIFDMSRSGCGITWDFFFPGKPRPHILNHLEDRDLWRFALPHTREIQSSMFSLPYEFELWDSVIQGYEDDISVRERVVTEGAAIDRKHFKDIRELLPVVTRPMRFGPVDSHHYVVPIANLSYMLGSDGAHLLASHSWIEDGKVIIDERLESRIQFAGYYWDGVDGRNFGLRAVPGRVDVSDVAKIYGGGGHALASGFRVPYDQLKQFEP